MKEPVKSSVDFLDLSLISETEFKKSSKKLKDLDEHDKARLAKAKAKNSLESFIVDTRENLYTEEFEKASTEEERNKIQKSLSEIGEWLEYESDDATTEVFKSKLSELKKLTNDLYDRTKEHRDRPEAVKALNDMINISEVFLNSARNMSEDDQIFTDVELKTLENLISDSKKWVENSLKEQNSLPLSTAPKMTIKLIGEKVSNLDREVKYLLNKARFAQPLKKKAEKEKEKEKEKAAKINETAQNSTNQSKDAENKTGESEKNTETQEDAPEVDIPVTETLEKPETSGENITPTPKVPSPDKVKDEDDKHTEL